MGVDIDVLIDEYLKRDFKPALVGVYWPSEIPGCIRQNYYKRFIPYALPPEKLRLFKSADLAHLFIRTVLSSSPEVKFVGAEKPFSLIFGDFEISGRLDDVIIVESSGEPLVIEVKSISGGTLEHISEAKMEHVLQVHPYLRATRLDGKQARRALLVYIARDTFATKIFEVEYDQRLMDTVIARAAELHRCLKEHVLPAPEAKLNPSESWRCGYCPYVRECGSNYNPTLPAAGGQHGSDQKTDESTQGHER
jgi:CRISPR/Cas system-associated exonuclease Cas4 (RecB family)